MPAILLFPAGLIFGSFATAVAHRIPRGESVVTGRSACPSCGEQIAAYDNIPVLSWLLLRGRCRNCGVAISPRYPLTELAMAALWTLTALVLGTDEGGELALGLVFVTVLVMVTLTDLERRVIPNSILIVGAAIGLGIIVGTDPSSLPERAAAALGAGGFLLVAALLYPSGMGMGDVKLAALMGLFLGREVAVAMLAALLVGALYGLSIMAREGAAEGRKRAVPFGPFLALGGLVGLLAGPELLDWYLDTFVG